MQAASAPRRAELAPADVAEGERVARRVWAMWRDRRPTQTLLGAWVTGPDGLSAWEAGTGWDDLVRLIARCLSRVAESAIIDHAVAAVGETVRDPVKALCRRLWKIARLDSYAYRRDRSRPAPYVLADQDLTGREQARRYRERRVAEFRANPDVVLPQDSRAADALREGQELLRRQAEQRRRAEAEQPNRVPQRREWVDDSAAPAAPRPSLAQIEVGLAQLAAQAEPAAPRADAWDVSAQGARRVGAQAVQACAVDQPAPAPRPSSAQAEADAMARRQADRDAASGRIAAQQAARDALRRALKGEG